MLKSIAYAASVAALMLLSVSSATVAQTEVARSNVAVSAPPLEKSVGKPSTEVAHRLESLEEQLREQADKLDKLMALVAEQQKVIAKLTERDANITSANPAPEAATTPGNTTTSTTDAQASASVDDHLKKLDEQVRKIGPFRFSGDFRLRFDGIFRSAEPNPPPGFVPLTHAQNVRMRYRLRFNFDTDINSKVSFHGQLATGPINNPLTVDQDFASITTRHPFFISEAWIDYHPNKATQLQAARVLKVFPDNPRFLFDDDIRFNGFN